MSLNPVLFQISSLSPYFSLRWHPWEDECCSGSTATFPGGFPKFRTTLRKKKVLSFLGAYLGWAEGLAFSPPLAPARLRSSAGSDRRGGAARGQQRPACRRAPLTSSFPVAPSRPSRSPHPPSPPLPLTTLPTPGSVNCRPVPSATLVSGWSHRRGTELRSRAGRKGGPTDSSAAWPVRPSVRPCRGEGSAPQVGFFVLSFNGDADGDS